MVLLRMLSITKWVRRVFWSKKVVGMLNVVHHLHCSVPPTADWSLSTESGGILIGRQCCFPTIINFTLLVLPPLIIHSLHILSNFSLLSVLQITRWIIVVQIWIHLCFGGISVGDGGERRKLGWDCDPRHDHHLTIRGAVTWQSRPPFLLFNPY